MDDYLEETYVYVKFGVLQRRSLPSNIRFDGYSIRYMETADCYLYYFQVPNWFSVKKNYALPSPIES